MIDLVTELKSVDWYLLGIGLELKVHQLQSIRHNYSQVDRRRIEVLNCWLNRTTTAHTWEAVAKVVGAIDYDKVADTIRKKYITSTFTTSNKGTVLLYRYVVVHMLKRTHAVYCNVTHIIVHEPIGSLSSG